jgi:phosphoribosylformimino-5-aminoimidazole carboxamide ribotide isomerase
MDLYPAIDLRGGRCVRLHQGDFDQETIYGDDPVAQAQTFAGAGVPWVHVVDLDASRKQGSNRAIVAAVATMILPVPVQTGGGVRDGALLEAGVERVVLGSLAIDDPGAAKALVDAYPGRVAIGLDHWDGEIRTRGWEERSGVQLLDAVAWPEFEGAASFVVTNIAKDATLQGPDLEGLAQVVRATTTPVVASGGVGTLHDLRSLTGTGVEGVIVGKALYEGRFTVEEAVAACRP